jgi:hypothetical protein
LSSLSTAASPRSNKLALKGRGHEQGTESVCDSLHCSLMAVICVHG